LLDPTLFFSSFPVAAIPIFLLGNPKPSLTLVVSKGVHNGRVAVAFRLEVLTAVIKTLSLTPQNFSMAWVYSILLHALEDTTLNKPC